MKVMMLCNRVHSTWPEWYPPRGTVGEVVDETIGNYRVQWPEGSTSGYDRWTINKNKVRRV